MRLKANSPRGLKPITPCDGYAQLLKTLCIVRFGEASRVTLADVDGRRAVACVTLQKQIWGYSDLKVYPLRLFVNPGQIGGQEIGAFLPLIWLAMGSLSIARRTLTSVATTSADSRGLPIPLSVPSFPLFSVSMNARSIGCPSSHLLIPGGSGFMVFPTAARRPSGCRPS